MSFIRRDPFGSYRPKSAKLSDLYKNSTGSRAMPGSVKSEAQKALEKAGYSRRQISRIVDNDRDVGISELKETVNELNDSHVFGFRKPGRILVDDYTRKEAVRKRNVRRLIAERQVEAAKDITKAEQERNDLIISKLKRLI